MQENNLSRADIAERLGCTPQYVSKILSGKTNFSFKTIAEIERRLGISCMEKAFAYCLYRFLPHYGITLPLTRAIICHCLAQNDTSGAFFIKAPLSFLLFTLHQIG